MVLCRVSKDNFENFTLRNRLQTQGTALRTPGRRSTDQRLYSLIIRSVESEINDPKIILFDPRPLF